MENPHGPRTGNRPRVVIVGGGFGGLEAASGLADAPVDVTLIDRQNYHCFQPLLYQVATAARSPSAGRGNTSPISAVRGSSPGGRTRASFPRTGRGRAAALPPDGRRRSLWLTQQSPAGPENGGCVRYLQLIWPYFVFL